MHLIESKVPGFYQAIEEYADMSTLSSEDQAALNRLIEASVPRVYQATGKDANEFTISLEDQAALNYLNSVLILAMAFGGFERAVEVCEHFAKSAKKSKKANPQIALNDWVQTQWKGLDFMESKVPGCTADFEKNRIKT